MTEREQPAQTLSELLTSDPEIMSGSVVFRGTRVTVETLFDNLADGLTVDEILDSFRTLDRDDVLTVLALMPEAAIAAARKAA